MPVERVAGRDTYVTRQGEGDPRLFIHCSLASHETLTMLAAELGPGSDTFFDLPGHGRSAEWTGEDYAGQATAIAAGLAQPGSTVVGHSFGAYLALRLAVERPDLVSRLILIEPVFFAAADTAAREAHDADFAPFVAAWEAGDKPAATAVFHALWGQGEFAALPAPVRAALIRRIHLIPAAAGALERDDAGLLTFGRLETITRPVHLVRGARTQQVIAAIHHTLARRIATASEHVIPGAAHMVAITRPQQVAAAVQS